MVHLEEPLSRSIFVLRPFQKKNPREKTKISPRCARRQAKRRRKNKRKSFLIFVSSDQKPQNGVFRWIWLQIKARGKFLGCFLRAKRACWRKVLEIFPLKIHKSTPKIPTLAKKKNTVLNRAVVVQFERQFEPKIPSTPEDLIWAQNVLLFPSKSRNNLLPHSRTFVSQKETSNKHLMVSNGL